MPARHRPDELCAFVFVFCGQSGVDYKVRRYDSILAASPSRIKLFPEREIRLHGIIIPMLIIDQLLD